MPARILIVVDGIFNLTTTYPAAYTDATYGPDVWFTISHLINTLNGAGFLVDTASRGFNAAGNFDSGVVVNTVVDPNSSIGGATPAVPFRFDDPSINLLDYAALWLFGFEGIDGTSENVGPGPGEPGGIAATELTAITAFMQGGGGLFAVGDHDGLGSAMCGRIPRLRYMRRWYSSGDTNPGIPPLAVANWPGGGSTRIDTLRPGVGDSTDSMGNLEFFFDNQSDDVPQPLYALLPSHPAVQGANGPLAVFPDHMHEGEVIAPSGAQLTATYGNDPSLTFAGAGFIEFPAIDSYQEPAKILAQVGTGTPGSGGTLVGHVTVVGEGGPTPNCENTNFFSDMSPSGVRPFIAGVSGINALAAYDGATMNVGRIVTDSSFHHYLDLNLLGDPCSTDAVKQVGFNGSAAGKAYLAEFEAFYINLANWLVWNRQLYFVFGKNNYGRDEVNDSLVYPSAFYVFLEGYTPNLVAGAVPNLIGSFNNSNIPGLSISAPIVTYEIGATGANANVTQRIRFEYAVSFTAASLNAFPAAGSPEAAYTLTAEIDIQGKNFPGQSAEFFLLGGEDPYFANVNATSGNAFYLSQDLRVFTIAPTASGQTPIGNVPFNFHTGSATQLDTVAGYDYIQKLIEYLNQQIGYKNSGYAPPDTNVSDPLNTLLTGQDVAPDGDSSVLPFTGSTVNYNFAIARVRLKGAGSNPPAKNVKVFFRVFTTQTFDTDYIDTSAAVTGADPQLTYPSTGSENDPQSPLPGTLGGVINGCSLPFFATANYADGPTDYNAGAVNNQNIQIADGDYAWAFFGCFLNVNDAGNVYGLDNQNKPGPVQYWLAGSAHSCLVAQIAYSDAPIQNVNGVVASPEISDKLAQRNLQVTTSGNPGFPATHKVPQTIDLRPSPLPQSTDRSSILSYPDEIMIDWGNTPHGSAATLYWPAVKAETVLRLAATLYPEHQLTAADPNTLAWEVTAPVSYIPIPQGRKDGFPGLLTVDLPNGIRVGNSFGITVRRITTRRALDGKAADYQHREAPNWRYITGSFHLQIKVTPDETILPQDENLLAILKWRLGLIGPGNRWYPVLLRYIEALYGRIDGMGGNAAGIPPSPGGYRPPAKGGSGWPHHPHHHHLHGHVGKVTHIRYDRFGDFEGFSLRTEHGEEVWFKGRESQLEQVVLRAFEARQTVRIEVTEHDPHWPAAITLLWPR